MLRKRSRGLIVVAVLAATAVVAQAQIVNIDIQPGGLQGDPPKPWDPWGPQVDYTGLGAAPDDPANTFWNIFVMDNQGATAEFYQDLLASDGVTQTTVGLKVGGNVGSFADWDYTNAAPGLMRDEAFDFNNGGAWWITGLDNDELYDVYVYMAGRNVGETSKVFIEEDTSTLVETSPASADTTELTEGEDYYIFEDVSPGLDAQIRVDFTGGIQGFQIVLPSEEELILGDLNGDTNVDGLDIQPFVDLIGGGGYQAEGDINGDDVVDGLDIQPFVDLIAGGSPTSMQAVPEPASLALLGLGGMALLRRRHRRV